MTEPAGTTARRALEWTCAVAAVALAARVAFVLAVPPGIAWDAELYERGARAIARGLGYSTFMFPSRSSDTVATAYYPVGYPAFVGALYAVFGEHLRVLQLAGCAVGAATAAVAHRLALRVRPGRAAHAAGMAVALMPGQVVFAGAAMTEGLYGLCLALAVYALARRDDGTRGGDLVLAGLALAAATYVRPQAVLLAPVLPLARASLLARGARGRALASLAVTAVTVACVLPWTARNCARLDGCAFVSTNGGSNLAIGAVPRARGEFFFLTAADGCAGVRGEVARDRCWRRVALDAIRRDPARWARLAPAKLEYTLAYEAFPIGYLRASGALLLDDASERALRRAITAPWLALLVAVALALAPIGARPRLPDAARVSLAACLATLATHAVFFGGDRYHLPLVAPLAAIAAGALRGLPPVLLGPRRLAAARDDGRPAPGGA